MCLWAQIKTLPAPHTALLSAGMQRLCFPTCVFVLRVCICGVRVHFLLINVSSACVRAACVCLKLPSPLTPFFFFFFWWMSRTSSRFLFILGTAVYRNRTGSEITHRRLLVVELRVCVCVCVRVTTANVTAWTQLAKFTTRAAKLFFCPRAKKKKIPGYKKTSK